jgi:hypothetical protein
MLKVNHLNSRPRNRCPKPITLVRYSFKFNKGRKIKTLEDHFLHCKKCKTSYTALILVYMISDSTEKSSLIN